MPKKGLYGKVNRAWEAEGEAELEGERKEEARQGRNESQSLCTGPLFSSINQMAFTFTVPCHFHSLKTSASLWHHLAAFSLSPLCHMTGPDALSNFCPHYQLPQNLVSYAEFWRMEFDWFRPFFPTRSKMQVQPMDGLLYF